MSICIISDHMIMLRQNFIINTQHIDQVKPKYEGGGGGGLQPPSPPSLDPPLDLLQLSLGFGTKFYIIVVINNLPILV